VLMMMDGILTDAEMAALNNEVEAGGADEKDVARNFLTDKGLL
jgi:Periplasmic glycine betaine/choline-binding (lipo)protein of an ABC-type transport system (osmoprotectant binding protein)